MGRELGRCVSVSWTTRLKSEVPPEGSRVSCLSQGPCYPLGNSFFSQLQDSKKHLEKAWKDYESKV